MRWPEFSLEGEVAIGMKKAQFLHGITATGVQKFLAYDLVGLRQISRFSTLLRVVILLLRCAGFAVRGVTGLLRLDLR